MKKKKIPLSLRPGKINRLTGTLAKLLKDENKHKTLQAAWQTRLGNQASIKLLPRDQQCLEFPELVV